MKKSSREQAGGISKLSRPAATGVVRRSRLFAELDASLDSKVIWISSPAGSGKTTLVSSYIDESALPAVWYQLDEGDADLATFFYYMGLAAKNANPRKRKPMPLLTPEYMMGVPTFTRRYFEKLCTRIKKPSILVFDNYHDVSPPAPLMPGSGFHDCMAVAAQSIPDDVSIVIISREEPPAEYSRLRAGGHLKHIRWDSIRFTKDETSEMISASERRAGSAGSIHKSTDGWASGIVLMLASGEDIPSGHAGREEIFDYFANEILRRADEATRDFMLRTSILRDIPEDIAHEITGCVAPKRVLSDLVRRNYFTTKKPGRRTTYEYHPLFREFLLERLTDSARPEDIDQLRSKAAQLLAGSGSIETAASLMAAAGDWEGLTGIVMVNAQNLLMQGRYQAVEAWLRMMPGGMVASNPWLTFWLGASIMPRAPHESFGLFKKTHEDFDKMADPVGVFLSFAFILDAIYFMQDDFRLFEYWIQRIDEIRRKYGPPPPGELGARVASNMLRSLVLWEPDHKDFNKWSEMALRLAEEADDFNVKMNTLSFVSLNLQLRGDVRGASESLRSLTRLAADRNSSPVWELQALLTEVMHNTFLEGMHEQSLELVAKGLELSKRTGIHVLDTLLIGNTAWNCISSGDFATSTRFIEMLEASQQFLLKWQMLFYINLVAYDALERGDLVTADKYADRALSLGEAFHKTTSMPHIYMTKAQVLHEIGHEGPARDMVNKARGHGLRYASPFHEWSCMLAEAQFALDAGDRGTCVALLEEALGVARREGYVNTLLWRPRVMARLLAVALEEGVETRYAGYLIERRALTPTGDSLYSEAWPHPLKVYTMGRFEVLRGGKSIAGLRRAGSKPMELLKTMIAFGGENVREEAISDALWPDADGDSAHSAFTTTLSRLRKALGNERAFLFNDGMVSLDPAICWVDAIALNRMLEGKQRHVASYDSALGLYRGNFLVENETSHWTHGLRERLKTRFLEYINTKGTSLIGKGHPNKAIDLFKRGIEIDPLAEALYRGLMLCFLSEGRRAEGISVYERCSEMLKRHFDVDPAPQTIDILNRLKD